MIIGSYMLHLYCDTCDRKQWWKNENGSNFKTSCCELSGDSKQHALRLARKQGWRINEAADKALCPLCVKEKA